MHGLFKSFLKVRRYLNRIAGVLATATVFTCSSCQSVYDVADNIDRHFGEPLPLAGKIREPVRDDVELSVLWVGHATVLFQIDDKVILTDPFFTNNIAQVLRRYVEPGLDMNDLRKCDLVLLSHSHMDHLNLGSLKLVADKFPGVPVAFPEGVEEYIPDYEIRLERFRKPGLSKKIFIGESRTVSGMKITSVASYHWGGRYGIDGKLWEKKGNCGFIIEYNGKTVYFSGDTAYDKDFFRYLGSKYKIDLAVVPIIYCKGCTEINLGSSHLRPKGILKILDDTKASAIVPVHYGTFTNPDVQYPALERLLHTSAEYKEKVKVLKLGEQLALSKVKK